ncbi:MAG: alpha/beta fold hydrolase [Acidobacteriota bacterium]
MNTTHTERIEVRIVVVVLLLAVVSVGAQEKAAPQLVSIGTHRLDAIVAGRGSVPVVFEGGLGNPLDTWQHVWPQVAASAPVVVYSRAGLGRSEPGSVKHTAHEAIEDLHKLLAAVHATPPYVLVGASYGGMLVRLYTSMYREEVVGLVIVEGVHEQQVQRFGELDPTYPAAFRASFEDILRQEPTGAEADEIRETMRIQAAGAVEGMKPLPDIPIAVLTSMRADPQAPFVNGTPRGHAAWRAMHDEWFQQSTNGIHIETSRSGHHIQDEEPQLVVDAIAFVRHRLGLTP